MKRFVPILVCFFFAAPIAIAQNSFSLGVKLAPGYTVPKGKSTLIRDGHVSNLRTYGGKSFGILGQYILGDKFGIESGILIQKKNFALKNPLRISIRKGFFYYWNTDVKITDYQIPILFIYKFYSPTHPLVHFKITGGLSLDWLSAFTTENLTPTPLFTNNNLLVGIRAGKNPGRKGRLEFGIEYQYSLGNYIFELKKENSYTTFRTKNRFLQFALYYFFLNREA